MSAGRERGSEYRNPIAADSGTAHERKISSLSAPVESRECMPYNLQLFYGSMHAHSHQQ